MLRAMDDARDTGRLPHRQSPPSPGRPSAEGGPFEAPEGDARYGNPSLDRYTDLRFERQESRGHRKWVVALFALVALLPLLVIGVMIAIYAQARNDEARPVDAIVVMGAAQYNGRPSEVLSARLDHALELFNDDLAPVIVVTGGNQPGDVYTEAEVGRQYLVDRGVHPDAILMENEGDDTWASMQNVADVTRNRGIETVLVVSDGFHLFRSERMADAVGFEAYSSAATDSPIEPWSADEFSYVIRETGAVILQAPEWLF